MKKYVLLIDSMIKTFSTLDTGEEISFKYSFADQGSEFLKGVNSGDLIFAFSG